MAIDRWKDDRLQLINDWRRKEIKEKMEEEGGEGERKSNPFVDLLVIGLGKKGENDREARLRIWDIRDDTYSIMKEGGAMRLKNMNLKATTKEGMLQLNITGRNFQMKWYGDVEGRGIESCGYEERKFLTCGEVMEKAMRGAFGNRETDRVDFVGKVKSVLSKSGLGQSAVYFVSGEEGENVVMIRRSYDYDDNESWKKWKIIGSEEGSIWKLKNLAMEPIDDLEGCGILQWTDVSEGFEVKKGGGGNGGEFAKRKRGAISVEPRIGVKMARL